MEPLAYYNEFDEYAAKWLENLIYAGLIARGHVDQRSIEDVQPNDLTGYTQCHFFAGVGVWSLALRRAGWPDSRPVWTGSCPCQPFSTAGKGNGFDDERHLWPAWFHLIGQRSPVVLFGEQVASKDADTWIDLVQTDMEALGYAFGAVPFPSAGVGAPHIRDRLYWVADAPSYRRFGEGAAGQIKEGRQPRPQQLGQLSNGLEGHCVAGRLDNNNDKGLEGLRGGHQTEGRRNGTVRPVTEASESCRLADAADSAKYRSESRPIVGQLSQGVGAMQTECRPTGPVNGRWSDVDWLLCRDGKWRPVEPGTFPLANGASQRVGRLRAYGNAINAEAAEAMIRAYMECRP